ncbi:unnamed protein product, partial [Discosporangium mesarthrocarpum]
LRVLEWVIGHDLTDPSSNSLCLYIYGPSGGEGKPRALSYLQLLLSGTISPLSRDYMSGGNESADDLGVMINNRFVVIPDAALCKGGKVNTNFIK